MRVTSNDLKRRFVYNWMYGRTQVKRVMMGRKQIWPGGEGRVRRVSLDVQALDSGVDFAFWQHALDATAAESSEDCRLCVEIGGRLYFVNSGYGSGYVARYELGVLDFGEDGPAEGDVRVGDVLELDAVVPVREGAAMTKVKDATVEQLYAVPWLPGSRLSFTVSKGKKKQNARWDFSVVGQGSGCRHIDGWGMIEGHRRGSWATDVWAKEMRVHRRRLYGWEDAYVPGDTGVLVRMVSLNGGTSLYDSRLVWPGFKRVFRLQVLSVELV